MEDQRLHKDDGKVPYELLSVEALAQIAKVMAYGRNKYKAHGWREGIAWSRIIGSSMRHLTAFLDGEDNDPESGLPHLAHLGCDVMFLLEYAKTHPELDDRYSTLQKVQKYEETRQ